MKEVIKTKTDLCTGCNRCVRECPMEMANVTYLDENGDIKVQLDQEKCIVCGRCVNVCKHNVRYHDDDTDRFFNDLSNGVSISLIAAPSVKTNIPDWKKLFTLLKQKGVKKIYDVSLGADICIWAHIRHIEQNNPGKLITQPCPPIVRYCQIYKHELLKKLSPVQSPMGCIAVYMKEYEGIQDRIAALSPCSAKANEFEDTELTQYNVTFPKMMEYLTNNNIVLPKEETEFDHDECGLGSLFPIPGGLRENIEFLMGEKLHIANAEGYSVYNKLDSYSKTAEYFLPEIFDVLNCIEGCNAGSASLRGRNFFKIDRAIETGRKKMTEERKKEYYKTLYEKYDHTLNLSHFYREYQPIYAKFRQIKDEEINKAFELLDKTDYEKQNVDCGACGSDTCQEMARKIALGVNIPANCMIKTVNTAKEEHELSLVTLKQFETIWNYVESCIMLIDAETYKVIDANPAAVSLFGGAKEDMIGEHCFKFFGNHDCPLREFDKITDRSEKMFINADGKITPILKSAVRTQYKGSHVFLESFNDISHLKDAEDKKRMLELGERVQLMLSANPQINILIDSDFKVIDCNSAAYNFLGFNTKEELLSGFFDRVKKSTPEFMSNGQPSIELTEKFMLAVKDGQTKYETEMHINGEVRILNVEIKKIPYEKNFAIVIYLYDVTEIREHETELLKAQALNEFQLAKLNQVVKATKIILWDMEAIDYDSDNPTNNFTWSDDLRKMLGFEDENDFPNKIESMHSRIHPEDRERVINAFSDHLRDKTGKTPYDIEYRMQKKDGKYVHVRATGEAIRDENGNPLRVAGAMMDITETKDTMLEHELQLTKLNLMIKAAGIALWDTEIPKGCSINPDNAFIWSDDLRRILGYTDLSDFPNVFSSLLNNLHHDESERVWDAFNKHLQDTTGRTPFDIEHRVMKKNGDYIYIRVSGETKRDVNGNPVRMAGAMLDVTEAKNLIHEAESQRMAAEAANKAKSAFLSTMSHEIRTPMNAILGVTEILLQRETLEEGMKEGLEKIYTSGDLLLGIINDILDLSKIEAGKLELETGKYDIASMVSDTAQLNIMRIGSKHIEFELHVAENVPAQLSGDELRIKQILNNLLSNAFKYTMEGVVKLSVTVEPSEKNKNEIILVLSVSDTGQGMTKKQVSHLFDEYTRFNLVANRVTEGTGLGMSITRNLISMMDGDINIESEKNVGSTFTVRLPQGKAGSVLLGKEMTDNLNQFRTRSRSQMKRVQITREPMPYGSVLIVDDVDTNIYVAKGLLVPYGLKIDSADSGYVAIEKIKDGKKYDLIFMDHMMPSLDGIETTKILRGMGYTEPIVALTANAVAGQADIFLENGFNDFISKPIDVRQMNHVLNKLIRDKQTPEVLAAARKQSAEKREDTGLKKQNLAIGERFIKAFIRDATKSLGILGEIFKRTNFGKPGSYDENDLRNYIIHTHGMKSALANVGKMDLSAIALKLEMAGREGKFDVIASETTAFLNSLNAFVEEIAPEDTATAGTQSGDKSYLREKLLVIKIACEQYDETTAENTIKELRKKNWSDPVMKLLDTFTGCLLHSDFDEIVKDVNKFLAAE